MKKANLTFFKKIASLYGLVILLFMSQSNLTAQDCSMGCFGEINLSLDSEDCQATITPQTMLADTSTCPMEGMTVEVYYNDELIYGPDATIEIDSAYVGKSVKVSVINESGNSCWGWVNIEDYAPPVKLGIPEDITIACYEDPLVSLAGLFEDCSDFDIFDVSGSPSLDDECSYKYIRIINRSIYAKDEFGNISDTCDIVIKVERIDFDDIEWPGYKELDCSEDTGPDWSPDPAITGYPVLNGSIDLTPGIHDDCFIDVLYSDSKIQTNKETKIIRTWTIRTWLCDGEEEEEDEEQIIVIKDGTAPTILIDPSTIEVSTSGHECKAWYRLPNADVSDFCTDESEIEVSIAGLPDGLAYEGDLVHLEIGTYEAIYTAIDGGGNSAKDTLTIIVEDHTLPVPVLIQYTVASLNSLGLARVKASSFDDGSYDDCGVKEILVKRMDEGALCNPGDTLFADYVELCCADIGTDVMVQFRVEDLSGNFNFGMVFVKAQDKLAPVITNCNDTIIDCDAFFELDSLELIEEYGLPEFYDNCGNAIITSSVNYDGLNDCNIGYFTRHFIVTDAGGLTSQCTQTITVENSTPFGIDNIEWPTSPLVVVGCGNAEDYPPEVTGKPSFIDKGCAHLGINKVDEIYEFNEGNGDDGSCFKIVRRWKVMDWCQKLDNGGFKTWEFTQMIIVTDDVAPVIDSIVALDSCSFDAACLGGATVLTATASDECSAVLDWSYYIDSYNTGGFPTSPTASGSGDTIDASAIYPIGTHRIRFVFSDRCGNMVSEVRTFTINNCKAPTPYMLGGLATDLMNMGDGTGMIEVLASKFDKGSFHVCDTSIVGQVYLSYSKDINDTSKVYTCADVGVNNVDVYVSIIIKNGETYDTISDFTTTTIDIQDNTNACGSPVIGTITVSGFVSTENNDQLKDAQMVMEGDRMMYEMSDVSGKYTFENMEEGSSYNLKPTKGGDYANGVSTLDLVFIQRHVLNLSRFDSPYKMIAADVNNDGKISTSDLVELRRLVLGSLDKLKSNSSWRFIDKNYSFVNVHNPLLEEYPESYLLDNLSTDMKIDFVAVKIGDVNATAVTNYSNQIVRPRSAQTLTLEMPNKYFERDEEFSITISSQEGQTLSGMQYTLNIDENALELLDVKSAIDNTDENNFHLNNGVLTSSWANVKGVDLNELVTLTFRAQRGGNIERALDITSEITIAEAYDMNFETMDIELRTVENKASFALYQNSPNPFFGSTEIKFSIPTAGRVKLSVYDVTGKIVKVTAGEYGAGQHSIQLNKNEIGTSGVLYYTLEAGGFTATKKMVLIK